MNDQSTKISALTDVAVLAEKTVFPVVTDNNTGTEKVTVNQLRSTLLFETAYDTKQAGLDDTESGETFFAFDSSDQLTVLGWVNLGADSAAPILGKDGNQVRYASIAANATASQLAINGIKYVRPEMFLIGSADVTEAIQKAFNASTNVDMSNATWNIARPITIQDGTALNLESARITAAVGSNNPLFIFKGNNNGLKVNAGGSSVTGTASAVFYFQGSSTTPTVTGHYARNIKIYGMYISSDTIIDFIYMKDAVRQVFIDGCYAFVRNGITASGKCVEVKVNKCILYGSDSASVSNWRVSLKSPAGSSYYNEGWHFTDCTIDGVGFSFDVTDIYTLTVNGGFLGGNVRFGAPTTTHCREIVVGKGAIMKGAVIFTPSATYDYRAAITPSLMFSQGTTGSVIANTGASGITVETKLESSGADNNQGIGVIFGGNNSNCHVTLEADNTFERLVAFNGTGERCSALIKNYMGSSQPIYTERPINVINSPVTNAVAAAQVMPFAQMTVGAVTTGGVMGTLPVSLPRGAKGKITINAALTGMTGTSAQILTLNVPGGIVIPSGTGWSASNIRPSFAAGYLSIDIPFYTTKDVVDNITLTNTAGNAVTVDTHAYLAVTV